MKNLRTALDIIETSLKEQDARQPTPPPGSTTSDGAWTTLPPLESERSRGSLVSTGRTETSSPENPSEPGPRRPAPSRTLASCQEDQAKLAVLLTQCYDALKVYGKEPEQLDNL